MILLDVMGEHASLGASAGPRQKARGRVLATGCQGKGFFMLTEFTPLLSLLGGVMIGIAAVVLMLGIGRVAGIAGILSGLFTTDFGQSLWRLAFLAGLIGAPVVYMKISGEVPEFAVTSSFYQLVAGGVLVGFGTVVGSGCTSGHGVCGLARFSRRSLVAVLLFMAAAMITVFIGRHVL